MINRSRMNGLNWPSLSIVIPALNLADYIDRTLLSIMKQNYEGELQVIVADGGSSDGTAEILKKYPSITWWSKPDKGVLDAIFQALEVATGDVVTILPGDDFYLKNAFRKTMPHLVANPEIDFVSGAFVILKANNRDVVLTQKQSCRISSPLEYISGEVVIPLQAAFIRRSAYDRVGGFRLAAEQCCDADFIYRMLHFSQGLIIPEYVSVFQLRPNQKTRLDPEKWITALRLMVEYCEEDDRYSRVFKLPAFMKREMNLRNTLFWHDYAGGLEGRGKTRAVASDILAHKQLYSEELVRYAHSFLLTPGQKISRRIVAAATSGSIVGKVNKLLAHGIDKLLVDVDWWRH